MENVRFVQLALHQGKAKKSKAAVTMVNIPVSFCISLRFFPCLLLRELPTKSTKDYALDFLSHTEPEMPETILQCLDCNCSVLHEQFLSTVLSNVAVLDRCSMN